MPVMPVLGVDFVGGPVQSQGPVALKWDPKNLEIRTTSVERTLEPLVIQVVINDSLGGTFLSAGFSTMSARLHSLCFDFFACS